MALISSLASILLVAALPAADTAQVTCPESWKPYIYEAVRLTAESSTTAVPLFSRSSDGSVRDCLSRVGDRRILKRIDEIGREIAALQRSAQASALSESQSSVCTASPGRYEGFKYVAFILPDETFLELPLDQCLARIRDSYARSSD